MKHGRGRGDALSRGAFTLAETIAVLIIVGITAVVSAPAFAGLLRLRHASLASEVERRLVFARAHSLASGTPTGVRFDIVGQTISTWTLPEGATALEAVAPDVGGSPSTLVSEIAPGASVSSVTLGGAALSTIWFSYKSVPHMRDEATGAYVGDLTDDVEIVVTGGHHVTVRRLTGLIER